MSWAPTLGSLPLGDGRCRFRVWAPRAKQVEVEVVEPRERTGKPSTTCARAPWGLRARRPVDRRLPPLPPHPADRRAQVVRAGRQEEFASSTWAGEVPDPQSAATFGVPPEVDSDGEVTFPFAGLSAVLLARG